MKNPLLIQFDLHQKLFNNVLEGFSDEESNQRLHGDKNMNHVKYLAGHLLNSQYGFGLLAGIEREVKWNDLFAAGGQSEAKDDIVYPSLEEIMAESNEMYPAAREGLKKLTLEELGKKPPAGLEKFWATKNEMWAFLNHHQAYHIGQIGILRKGFGKETMRYD